MKKMNFRFLNTAMLIMALSLFVVSCDKKDEPKVEEKSESKIIKEKDVQDVTKWYYFSFEKDDFIGVGEADPAKGDDEKWSKRTDWDIAFHLNNVRTNSGTSGIGKGGMMELQTENFEEVKEFTENNFKVDEILENGLVITITPKHTFAAESSVNMLPNRWAAYNHAEGVYVLQKKNVYIVRTADGKKYAKIQFINFLNDKSESKFITMKYAYQKDGSTKF